MKSAQIATRLTDAQKRAILALGGIEFVDYKQVMKRRDTRMKLTNSGITEPLREGPVTMYSSVRLSRLGMAVKMRLLA